MSLADERELLVLVLDVLVPEGDGFPGAGAVAIDHVLAVAARSADNESLVVRGLRAIEQAAGGAVFASLDVDAREAALRRVEQSHAEFVDALVTRTYEGYYSHPSVIARLGLDARPPHPRGHAVETVELPELARVTARGPLFRPA